jgi:hypothetical protein
LHNKTKTKRFHRTERKEKLMRDFKNRAELNWKYKRTIDKKITVAHQTKDWQQPKIKL